MKIAIFSDLHLGIKQDSTEWHNIALQWCDWFVKELKVREIKTIFFLGDFFHNKFVISSTTLYTASLFLDKLRDFQIHIIFGNHDLYYLNNPEIASVNIFKGYQNIHIYSKPDILELDGKYFVFCGWGYNPLNFTGDVLLTHAEIDVFQFNDLITCQSDLKPSNLLKNYKHVISGHFHQKQIKTYENGVIEYIGNPFQMDFSNAQSEKVFGILDTINLSMEYVINPISPQFIKYNLSDLVQIQDVTAFTKQIKNVYLRIIVDKNITSTDANELRRLLLLCEPRDIKLEWIDKNQVLAIANNIEGFNLSDIIKEYITGIDIEYKEEIKNYILNLFKKYAST